MSGEQVWQVRLADGSVWVPPDSAPGSPRASWIYARSTADMFARQLGGSVVEVPRRQQERLLDREISDALAAPRPRSRRRRLGRTDRRERAEALSEYLELPPAARGALEVARDTSDMAEYEEALRRLSAALPPILWMGRDDRDRWLIQEVAPVWITEDPTGEDPAAWDQVDRGEVAHSLVEDA